MSTGNEITEAVRHLAPEQRQELLVRLEPVLFSGAKDKTPSYLSDEFTKRLAAHFRRAKQAALSSS